MSEEYLATMQGTQAYKNRFQGLVAESHFRLCQDLWMSSIGLGTYLGGEDDASDQSYEEAIVKAMELGCNVIDTAINYRFQRSERAVGKALHRLFQSGKYQRQEIIVATKGGFIPYENHSPRTQEEMNSYFEEQFLKPRILSPEDVVAGCHSLKPRYLENQLEKSLTNLNLSGVDIYYLHNPETQLSEIPRQEFYKRILSAFEFLERCVEKGKIGMYGMATWNGFRTNSSANDYLSLAEMIELARAVGGDQHHFKVVQLPFNLAMPEAFGFWNQRVSGQQASLLKAAEDLGLTVMASASLLQAQLSRNLPAQIQAGLGINLESDAQRAIQFVRSAPGISVALVGMGNLRHVEENLHLVKIPPMNFEEFRKLFKES